MTGSRSVADEISGVSPQQRRRPRTDDSGGSARPDLAVRPVAEPSLHPGLVVAASLTDASATAPPAETGPSSHRTPDNQALDRSRPVLPVMPGMPGRRTHDYLRHGITSLFAAFNIADGTVISELHRRHRAIEFRKFLAVIDKAVPAGLDVHLACDNYATHNTAEIRTWLARRPRFHVHFTPAGSSWMNQAGRWFGLLTDKLIRRGARTSVQALENDIKAWITTWNENPRPFTWTKTADEILNSLAGYLGKLKACDRVNQQD
jgi:transposase